MERLPTILIPDQLAEQVCAIEIHHKPPKGHSESQFERDLWRYFPGKIHTGFKLKRPELNQAYIPDFAYIDPEVPLHIDIEIDEPYSFTTRQPLHYLGEPKDQQRNQFFLAQGWIVIRLSEAQVVKFPDRCCKVIASTIATLTQNNAIMAAFRQIPTLKPERRWNVDQAQKMSEQGIRESYQKRSDNTGLISQNLVFHCPVCGESVYWKSHYVQCSNCGYDNFAV